MAYSSMVDNKGRVTVPAPLRSWLGEMNIIVTPDAHTNDFLVGYRQDRYAKIVEQFDRFPGSDPYTSKLRRRILGNKVQCLADKQGRILLSKRLWDMIGVAYGDEIYFVDVEGKLEIWRADLYDKLYANPVEFPEGFFDSHAIPDL